MKNITIKQAVILAGGLGTRLKPFTDNNPKPMIPINGKPFLEYLINLLKENGIEDIVLLLGYLPDKIIDYFGDGKTYGVKIKYSVCDVSFDTGKRIAKAQDLIDDNFLLMYCDNYFPFKLSKLMKFHNSHDASVTVTIYNNKDRFTKSNMKVDESGYVTLYDKKIPDEELSGVDVGFFIVNKSVFKMFPDENFSFQKVVLSELIRQRKLAGFLVDHRYCSIGDTKRIPLTEAYLKNRKIIFLDRDGVINKKAPKADYIKKWEEFKFLPGAVEAMKLLAKNNYEMYIISNQAGIARGMMTIGDLEDIHKNMLSELEKKGIKIQDIFYCPHGWDEGCDCRKPKPGMFYQASNKYNIDLSKTVFIGDDERDMEAGNKAGVKTYLVDDINTFLKTVESLIK